MSHRGEEVHPWDISRSFPTELAVTTQKSPKLLYTFPPEILSLIFGYTLPTHDDIEDWMFFLPIHLALGKICSYWRRVVWSTPRLWSIIAIYYDSEDYEPDVPLTLVDRWLTQSKERPLIVWIAVEYAVDDS
ncbi:hypothetical protein CPB83DRAFT_843535 [Crepidotus variabilis]|uniref:F-box domain-containing protein n=1 Tax=Crepidotus variabilis TaxID=179855 RepID=A0A9P6JV78_9AGAR|nr:hypothetical protein CPB83DRAFT_843535 [Crepidotus variabilis]